MCYYVSVYVPKKTKLSIGNHEVEVDSCVRPVQGGFEFGDLQIIKKDPRDNLVASFANWELIPFWLKNMNDVVESRKKFNTLNATGENLFERKTYKQAAAKRRCIIPVTGFYEWRHYKPEGGKKDIAYPYYITADEIMNFAGIWQQWTDQETGESMDTFAIVTTAANELMQQIHNTKLRMPTILTNDLADEWLSNISDNRVTEIATHQFDSEEMQAWTVAKDFKNALDPLQEFDYPELPGLYE